VSMLLAGVLLKMGGYARCASNAGRNAAGGASAARPAADRARIVNIIYGALTPLPRTTSATDRLQFGESTKWASCCSGHIWAAILTGLGMSGRDGLQMISHGLIALDVLSSPACFYERRKTLSDPRTGRLGQGWLPIPLPSMASSLASPGPAGHESRFCQ